MDKDKIKDLILTLVDMLDDTYPVSGDDIDKILSAASKVSAATEERLRTAIAVAVTDSQGRDAALSERIKQLAERADALEAIHKPSPPAGGRAGIEDPDAG